MSDIQDYLAREAEKDRARKAGEAAIKLGIQENPDEYVKALALSFKTGIPVQGVKDGMQEVEQAVKQVELVDLLKESPALEQWMGAHPDNTALSHDDLESLSKIASSSARAKKAEQIRVDAENKRRGLSGFSGAMKGLGAKLVAGVNELAALPGELTRTVADATIGRAFGPEASRKTAMYANPLGTWLANTARSNADYLSSSIRETPSMFVKDPMTGEEFFNQNSINPAKLSTLESAANIMIGEAPSMAAMLGLEAVTGGGATPLAVAKYGKFLKPLAKAAKYATRPAALMEVGRTIQGQRQQGVQELMSSKGISREQAEIEVAPGAIMAGVLSFGFAAPMEAKILEDLLGKVAKAPNGKAFAAKALGKLKAAVVQGGKEGIQEVVNGIGEDTAAWLTYNPDKTFADAAKNAAENFFGGAVLGGVTAASIHGQLQEMSDASAESKLRQRSPEKFREAVQEMVKDSPVEQVQIPAEAYQTYFQSKGIDPAEAARSMGVTNYAEALAAGTELVVPTAGLMTFPEHFEGLSPDIRIGGNVTPREMEAYQQEASKVESEVAKQGVESVKDAEDPIFKRIYEDTRQQLVDLGRSPSVADAEATKHAAVMSNLAKSAEAYGLDPEMVLRWQPKITRPAPGESLTDRVMAEYGQGRIPKGVHFDDLHPDDQAHVVSGIERDITNWMDLSDPNNPKATEEFKQAYRENKETHGGRLVNGDIVYSMIPTVSENIPLGRAAGKRVDSGVLSYVMTLTKDLREQAYELAGDKPVGITAGGQASGKTTLANHYLDPGDFGAVFGAVIDAPHDDARTVKHIANEALSKGKDVAIVYVDRPDFKSAFKSMIRRAIREGRHVELEDMTGKHVNVPGEMLKVGEDFRNSYRVALYHAIANEGENPVFVGGKLSDAGKDAMSSIRDRVSPTRDELAKQANDAYTEYLKGVSDGNPETPAIPADIQREIELGFPGRSGQGVQGSGQTGGPEDANPGAERRTDGRSPQAGWPDLAPELLARVQDHLISQGLDLTKLDMNSPEVRRAIDETMGGESPFTLFQDDRKAKARAALSRALTPSGQSQELTRRAGEAKLEEDAFLAWEEGVKAIQAGDVHADTGEVRGFIQFGNDYKVQIGLLEKANLSTITHEFHHLYTEIIRDMAEAGHEQAKADLAILRKSVGAEGDAPLTKEQHEQIARWGEAYLMEGKAPSEKLRGVFNRVKYWMMGVYRSLSGLGVRLNDDVRGVFDRLYASDAEIEQARSAVNDRPLFATAEEMKATQAEFEAYARAKAKEIQRAKDAHASKVLAELTREKEAWWEEESSKVREEVAAEVDADRLYKSFSALRDGQMEDGTPIKLNKEALEAQFGKGVGKELPRGFQRIYSREGGMDADSAAELLGWRSGEAMIESLKNLEPRDERIKRLTDQRMKERHGDIMAPEALAEAAQEAIHEGDPESKLIELRILRREQAKQRPMREAKAKLDQAKESTKAAKAEGEAALKEAELQAKSEEFWRRGVVAEVPPMATFKRAAADLVDAMQGKDYQPFRYLEAERRLNREAQEALAKNDYAAAADATQKSILNHFLFREATKAKAAMEADYEYVRKFGKKSVRERIAQAGGEQGQHVFLDQIDNLLGMYQFTRETKKSIEARQSLAQFALDQANAGEMVSFDPMLFSQPKNYRELTRPELQAVMDGLKNLEAMARRDLGFIKDGKTVALKEAVQEMTDSAYGNLKSKPLPVDKNARSTVRKISDRVKRLDAEFLKMEELVDRLDGGDINGPFRRYVFEPMCEAQYKEYELTQKITSKLSEAMEAMPKEQRFELGKNVDVDEVGTVKLAYIIDMALNTGNESNMFKLREGMVKDKALPGVTSENVDRVIGEMLGRLGKHHWEFVQKTWDALDSLWPEIEALELRMSGVAPKRVEVHPFTVTLADGSKVEMRGGYFPVVYDPGKSGAGAKQGDIEIMKQDGGWNAPVTAKGHTKERNEAAAHPLLMDFEQILSKHVARVVKDLSHREAATAVAKLLQNQDVRTAIQTTLGPEYEAQFMPWLKSTVNDTAAMNPELGKFLLATRSNMVIGSLAFRASSVIVQATDFGRVLIGHHRVGPAHLASALAVMARNPIDTVRQIRELSPEMTTRAENLDRDARATLKRLLGKDSVYAKTQRFGMQGLAIADLITSHTAWLGAYKQALAKGSTQAEAVKMADRVVRTKLMTGAPKDLTPIQRKGSGMQMLTTYMGDATAIYNMMSSSAFDIAQGKNRMNAVFTMVMAGMVIPLLGDIIKGKWPKDDDDEKAAWIAKQAAWNLPSSIPLVRDVASAMESGRDYQFTPLASALNKGAKFASKDIPKAMEGDVEWDNFFMHGLDAAGTLSGLPGTGQAMTTLRYARDLESGKEDPETKAGAAWGLVMGARKSK